MGPTWKTLRVDKTLTKAQLATLNTTLSLGELTGKSSGQHGGDAGGDHEADVTAVGEHSGEGLQGRGRVIDELERSVTAHEVGVRVGVNVEQVGGVTLHSHDPLGDPGVAGSTMQRSQRVEARVDDRDVMTELSQRNGQTASATAQIDDTQAATKLMLALGHDGPHGLPDG